MAGRFMKIKKVIIPFMTLVVMTSQLAGCATMSSDEMLKTMQESPDVSIEYAVPDSGQQILDASDVINVGDQRFVSGSTTDGTGNGTSGGVETTDTEDEQDIGMIEQQQEVTELSGAALEEYFQLAYDSGTSLEGDLETRISGELDILVSLVDVDDSVKLPGGYADQYRAWRPAEVVDPFTEVNETVYATGTVNLRSGPSTAHDKVGSLNKSDSVTRVGIGTAEAEGWSRIQLSDGSTVYVSNKYLSTTKPVVQQQQPSGGGQLQIQQPTQSGSQQQSQPSGGQSQEDKNRADNEAAGQGLAGMNQWATEHNTGENHPELRPGATVDENGNIGNAGLNVQ